MAGPCSRSSFHWGNASKFKGKSPSELKAMIMARTAEPYRVVKVRATNPATCLVEDLMGDPIAGASIVT